MYHYNPVYAAIRLNNYRRLEKLAKEGIDINAPVRNGWTPAHHAAGDGHIKCLEVLAKYIKTDINTPDKQGNTPADFAATKGHVKCVEFLTKHKELKMKKLTQEQLDERITKAAKKDLFLDLADTDCSGLIFSGLDLRHADFTNANCERSFFNGTNLSYACFIGTNCSNVIFRYATCKKVNFIGTNCRDADFTGTNLKRADFTDANYEGAIFTSAKGVRGLILLGGKIE